MNDFVRLACFLASNSCLPLAFFASQFPRRDSPRWVLPLIVIARIAFIPLFMFCNVKVADGSTRRLRSVFNHDAWFIGFMVSIRVEEGLFKVSSVSGSELLMQISPLH